MTIEHFLAKKLFEKVANPALLIGNVEDIFSKLNSFFVQNKISLGDRIIVSPLDESITIEQLKEAIIKANRPPFNSPMKALIIKDANKMTLPTQNSFLKNLEEPEKSTNIILIAVNDEGIIPTIISRVEIYSQNKTITNLYTQKIEEVINMDLGDRLFWVQNNYRKITNFEIFLDEMIIYCAKSGTTLHKYQNLINRIYRGKTALKKNVNEKLIMEYILS